MKTARKKTNLEAEKDRSRRSEIRIRTGEKRRKKSKFTSIVQDEDRW